MKEERRQKEAEKRKERGKERREERRKERRKEGEGKESGGTLSTRSGPAGNATGVLFKTICPPDFRPELLPAGIRQDEGDFPGLVSVRGELRYIACEAWIEWGARLGVSLTWKQGRPDRRVRCVVVMGGIPRQLALFPNGPPRLY